MKINYFYPHIMMLAMALFAACGHHAHDEHDHDKHSEETAHDHDEHEDGDEEHKAPGEVVFTLEQARMAGVRVEAARKGDFRSVVHTGGRILPAPGQEMTAAASAEGIVTFAHPSLSEGTEVQKGQTLFTISARNIQNGDPIEKAKQTYEAAQREYQRAEELVKDHIISQKDYEQRRLDYLNARTAYEALANRSTEAGVRIVAPMKGYVKTLAVRPGDFVSLGQTLATLSQNNSLVLQAELPESMMSRLADINSANFCTPADGRVYPLSELNGRLISKSQSVNEEGYLPLLFRFDNRGSMVAGAYVEVYLLGQSQSDVLTLPCSALTEEQGHYFVFRKLSDEHYLKCEVQTAATDGQRVSIAHGISEGDSIVVAGAMQIKLASLSSVIPEGHSHH